MIRAVILAGGEGTRLRPLTATTPKSLLPICNRPFLWHQLEHLARHGIRHAILLTGYLADHFGPFAETMAARGLRLEVSREATPLDTCGAVRSVLDRLDGTTVVANGDVLTELDLGAMIAAHRQRNAALSIALKPVADAGPYGLVRTGPDGRVLAFLEKPEPAVAAAGGTINAGTYLIEPEVLADVPPGVPWSFERQTFPELVGRGEAVYGFVSDAYWLDIGTPERYLRAHRDLLQGATSFRPDEPERGERIWVAPGAVVEGTLLPGTLVGPRVTVAAQARVGPNVSCGPDVTIEAGAIVRDAVLLEGARVAPGVTVHRSVLGPHAVADEPVIDAVLGAGERPQRAGSSVRPTPSPPEPRG